MLAKGCYHIITEFSALEDILQDSDIELSFVFSKNILIIAGVGACDPSFRGNKVIVMQW